MIKHELFPTIVGQTTLNEDTIRRTKHRFLEEADTFKYTELGDVSFHLNHNYDYLFYEISDNVRQFIDLQNVDILFTKTWLNSIDQIQNDMIPLHDHREAHYSWVYYVNTPPNSARISFVAPHYINDPFKLRDNFHVTADVKEGNLLVFPSTLKHFTHQNVEGPIAQSHSEKRISIAGDIILTHSQRKLNSHGLQPTSMWRQFD